MSQQQSASVERPSSDRRGDCSAIRASHGLGVAVGAERIGAWPDLWRLVFPLEPALRAAGARCGAHGGFEDFWRQ